MKRVQRSSGFTYIEMLFAMLVLSLVLSLLPLMIRTLGQLEFQIYNSNDVQLEFFMRDLTDDLKHVKRNQVHVRKDALTFEKDGDIIRVFIRNHKIHKTVNGRGDITLLYQVSDLEFIRLPNDMISVKILNKRGQYAYEKLFYV
ncbi:competence type IV pilus minor pilin ComGF [Staphylococcus massiliensis]|uniref:Competence protein ComGF n=1 Tax=Staphylococcus massiliensis S46 TaxID=1229783 RepID=K9B829_9STAP|nr:competence type IV pilus minor pilin ComGF [Staphylococcus massiliensis]EKU49870.1 hypothetical protein C273_03210 [Staphylococcus massiliensis S46]MCG3398974.1 hypothetical protein [Staphylococcus massiliensis]MCG3401024.1 hypothetical protein [Staphylococcus massiliensis]MCG3413023.1 hypothetical protein [Staphylococcus massiliensis]POA02037.1 hypothetical protein CD133_00105 [Staphylococcus massiliensis CCUG 55927]